jgi:hypothetical protein
MYEAIEITIAFEQLRAHGVTDALEDYLQLEIERAAEGALDVGDVIVSYSGWSGIEVWNEDGDKIDVPEDIGRTLGAIVAAKLGEAARLALDVGDDDD